MQRFGTSGGLEWIAEKRGYNKIFTLTRFHLQRERSALLYQSVACATTAGRVRVMAHASTSRSSMLERRCPHRTHNAVAVVRDTNLAVLSLIARTLVVGCTTSEVPIQQVAHRLVVICHPRRLRNAGGRTGADFSRVRARSHPPSPCHHSPAFERPIGMGRSFGAVCPVGSVHVFCLALQQRFIQPTHRLAH